jgi:Fe-S-cluster-containing dehydrogenase component
MKPTQTVIEIVPAEAAAAAEGAEGTPGGFALTRRQAMTWMAASAALASAGCSRPPDDQVHPFVRMPEAGTGGEALYYASSFVRNGFAHGVLVGTREGRPIKIEGNPLHPASLGRTDVFAQASVLQLWDPERSQVVRHREKASGPALPSTWGAFDAAWQQRAAALRSREGTGLRVLTGCVTSPTLQAQLDALLVRFPKAVLHRHDPRQAANAWRGTELAFGRPLRLRHDAAQARLVVALDADPFSGGPDSIRFAADWARARHEAREAAAGGAARLVAVETTPGLFGARADERLALPPRDIEALVARVAALCGVEGAGGESATPDAADTANPATATDTTTVTAFAARLAAALQVAGAGALVIAGESLSPRTHALVCALHQRLGAWDRTVQAIDPPEGTRARPLAELLDAVGRREVDTLLVLDTNPAYDAPGELQVAQALSRVPFVAHAGLYDDETAHCSHWHLPLSHVYEQWSDARAFDGSASLVQPAIAPLYDTRSAHELLASLLDDPVRSGRELVRRQWRAEGQGDDAFEAFWRKTLRAGRVEGSAFAPVSAGTASVPAAGATLREGGLVAVFVPDPCVGDGAFANSGWLQELPRPLTQITWANALHLGPRTAQALGLRSGDVVAATAAGRSVEAPVWVQAAHAEGAATLPLGLGRRNAGQVGNSVGFDAYALRPADDAPVSLQLRATGRRTEFARTQTAMEQQGRELARSVPASHAVIAPEPPAPSLYPATEKHSDIAWGMAIDLDACIGCNACTVACQAENNIPVVGADQVARGRVMHWIRIDRYEEPEVPAPPETPETPGTPGTPGMAHGTSVFQPVPCMHCENAPCEIVCPVGATVHDSEGLNVQVYNRCVGTRFCSNNCPYKVRRFNFLQYSDELTDTLKAQRNPEVTVRARGVMEKCTYCVQRVTRARLLAEKSGTPLADGDVVTACQSACPTAAIHFGNVADPRSAVSRAKASARHYAMLGELNTRPRTTYLARVVADKAPGIDQAGKAEG